MEKTEYEEDWEKMSNFFSIYPDYFDPVKVDKYVYLWALGFL